MPSVARLTDRQLLEFQLRKTTVDHARNTLLMVEESFEKWCKDTVRSFGVEGKFDIDLKTGEIVKRAS